MKSTVRKPASLRVLVLVYNSFEKSIGGIERYTNTLLSLEPPPRVSLHMLLPASGDDSTEVRANTVIHRTRYLNEGDPQEVEENSLKLSEVIQSKIIQHRIDVVLAENFHFGVQPAYCLAASIACLNTKTPLVLQMHSYAQSPLSVELVRCMPWNHIISISKNLTHHVYDKGVNMKKLSTIYMGTDTESFKPGLGRSWLRRRTRLSEDDFIILHASRIVCGRTDLLREKGIVTLLQSFSFLAPRHGNLRLVIAAAKPPQKLNRFFKATVSKILDLAELHGVGGKVKVESFALREMPQVYNGADLLVLASETETFGQVYVEALACGTPVIGSKVGGVPEIIESGKNGYLLHPNDPTELAKRIERFVNDPSLGETYSQNGIQMVRQRFGARKQFTKLVDKLTAVVKASRKSRRAQTNS